MPLFDEEALDIADNLKSGLLADDIRRAETRSLGVAALTMVGLGVVCGDIGTSPTDVFRQVIRSTSMCNPAAGKVLDILSLYTLVWRAAGKKPVSALLLALAGAALFEGDTAITPAILVLSFGWSSALKFDRVALTFFLGRRRAVATGQGWELVMDRLYAALSRVVADPADFYHLPRDRVVELGDRVAI